MQLHHSYSGSTMALSFCASLLHFQELSDRREPERSTKCTNPVQKCHFVELAPELPAEMPSSPRPSSGRSCP